MKTLQAWVQHNPQYHGLEIIEDAYSDGSLMDEVTQLMLQAAAHAEKQSPVGGGSGVADVQVVLGVLYNVTRNFSGAVGAFLKAAEARPGDYSVWNKLGATRANSMASEAAVPAYHRALALKPRYARGWLNLGIAHANLGHGASAARCYLHALELNPDARHIWNYVRMALTATDRYDLVPLANALALSKCLVAAAPVVRPVVSMASAGRVAGRADCKMLDWLPHFLRRERSSGRVAMHNAARLAGKLAIA